MLYSINKRNIGLKKIGAILLAVMFLITTMAPAADAQWRYHRHRRPSKTKHIAVGTAIGAVGGALMFLGSLARVECAQVAALAGLRVFLARVEPILT